MLLVFGVTLDQNKKIKYALPKLYGIGRSSAIQICKVIGIAPEVSIKNLTEEQQLKIITKIKEEFRLEGNLREEIKGNIQRYITNGSIRGFRHKNKLPVRGQRTHSNGKTPRRVHMGMSWKTK